MGILNSLLGMVALLAIAFILSKHKKSINKRTVGVAFAIQFGFGALILYVPAGRAVLEMVSNG
ncbi:MAG: Na+ dependent nucleoside transporter N-terminal domain-containing protein, partial [Alysiella sp.]|uniref:Na+ dependent nucleoside transporter N-terminal domain-containing protein n=1 Tax=Alysiella sp. TaxID=1872483 RepID=UPI0026DB22E7